MYGVALFPGVTISPVVPDVTLAGCPHLSLHVPFELQGKQSKLKSQSALLIQVEVFISNENDEEN